MRCTQNISRIFPSDDAAENIFEVTAVMQGIWKTDEDEKGIFIDAEEETLPPDHEYSQWDQLPDIALGQIFSYLTIRDKYWASMTCRHWYHAFHLSETWAVFELDDYTLTRRRFNYYSGWQYTLDHWRTMQCLSTVGCHFRCLHFESMMNFYNLYEFMNMLSYYIERGGKDKFSVEGVGRHIKSLYFSFPCNMRQKAQAEKCRIYGTGGQILNSLKRLMGNLKSLTELYLIDLQLEYKDARYLLDDVCFHCCTQLKILSLVNLTKEIYPLLHPGVFLNLRVLVISPQNLCEDLIVLLGSTKIKHLHIKTTMYSPTIHGVESIHHKTWQTCKSENPQLEVHLETTMDVLWQECAPVVSLTFTSRLSMVHADLILTAVERYGRQFKSFAHLGMPYFHRSKSFHDRADGPLLLLCRSCPLLESLVIRERVSTASILLIATTAKTLKNLVIRKNAVIIRTDWPKSAEWSDEFYEWLKRNSRSYDAVEREVSQILGYRWKMISDSEFKHLKYLPYSCCS